MNKVEEIFKSWNIAFNPNDEQAELASKRIEICNSCEHKVTNLGINRCSVCGCALKGKVFSPIKGACPKGKWDKVDKVMKKNTKITPEDTIFVQIASYRDPQLLPTLKDLFGKADHPNNLRITIAWQTSPEDTWDNLDEYLNDSRVNIVKIPYQDAKGVCWARNLVQQYYGGEKYTLQLDSHHRFEPGWDTTLITMIRQLQAKGHEKPLLTAYIPSYNPEKDPEDRAKEPWWMTFDRFTPEGVVFFLPAAIPDWENLTEPIPSRFYSAHFAFSVGEFSLEVQHDPSYYFHGEEITIAVRAFTQGYDLFHPHKIVAYHEYTREGRTKHWDDSPNWNDTNIHTHQQVRKLLGIDNDSYFPGETVKYGLGNKRTLQEYERYAGIRFRDRSIQQYTLDNNVAPNPPVENYDESFYSVFKHCIDLHRPHFQHNDYDLWVIAFEMNDGTVVDRQDADEREIKKLIKQAETTDQWIRLWRTYTGKKPEKWVVWPHSKSAGWVERLEHPL